ncbi:MAG TPA: Mur ligase domain-containing protein, partial [Polyangiaceae bacterium LLY-WYZ-15_(1-7)]|nr:Mur ligase domain-containing protein [Polyangiaceae bacterium LLY-WYZ-15_(1-7)]
MHVHLIGVCGTGMGALAGLLVAAGHRVTGSDRAFHPPMGPALAKWGVETMPGWDPANLEPAPDLVVVGNVCRPDNPEARAAIDGGLAVTSFPAAMEEMFLAERPGFVVAGTHGKTTTTT